VWISEAKRYHSTPPRSLVFVYAIGDGSFYAIDTSRTDAEQESPIVFWEPGDEEVDKLEVTDVDFGSFALREIT